MKAIRELLNIVIGFFVFLFIFAFAMAVSVRSAVKEDLLGDPIRNHIVSEYSSQSTDKERDLIRTIINDKDSSQIVNLVIDNYIKYNEEGDYQLSVEDADTFRNFMIKYKDKIIELKNEEVGSYTEKEFNENTTYEKLNETANSIYGEIDATVQESGMQRALDIYFFATSNKTLFYLVLCVIGSAVLLMLINWSLVKWAKIVGIGLNVTGGLLLLLYIIILVLKIIFTNNISDSGLTELVSLITFNGLLIRGVLSIIIGTTLIVIYNIYKDKKFFVKKEKTTVEPQQVIEQPVMESKVVQVSEVKSSDEQDIDIL